MSPAAKETHRRIRRNWGLGLMVAWIVGWYVMLNPGSSGVFAQGLFGAQLLLVIATSPLAFVVSHIVGRNMADQEDAATERRYEEAEATRLQAEEADRRQRIAQSEEAALASRQSIDRREFIQKLGSVNDLLDVLPGETEAARIATIKLGVAQQLRDLTAKHTLDGLTALVRIDEAIRLSLTATLGRLEAGGMGQSPEAQVLRQALARGQHGPTLVQPARASGAAGAVR